MRARGAKVTDIAVLVVAADDGVMPQTVEAIDHAKAAEVPIIVAINKIDKAGANPNRVRQQLAEQGLTRGRLGRRHQFIDVSAKTRQNLDDLLETLVTLAEIQELRANPDAERERVRDRVAARPGLRSRRHAHRNRGRMRSAIRWWPASTGAAARDARIPRAEAEAHARMPWRSSASTA